MIAHICFQSKCETIFCVKASTGVSWENALLKFLVVMELIIGGNFVLLWAHRVRSCIKLDQFIGSICSDALFAHK